MSFKVRDYMEINFPVTSFETPICEVASMIANGVHDLVVVMEKGIPKGFVSADDIVSKVVASGSDPAKTRVMDVMSTLLSTVDPDDDLRQASEIIRRGADLLLVVKNGIFLGVVTPRTLAMRFGEYTDKAVKDVVRYLSAIR